MVDGSPREPRYPHHDLDALKGYTTEDGFFYSTTTGEQEDIFWVGDHGYRFYQVTEEEFNSTSIREKIFADGSPTEWMIQRNHEYLHSRYEGRYRHLVVDLDIDEATARFFIENPELALMEEFL